MKNAVCTPWVSPDELAACCPAAGQVRAEVVEDAVQIASEWLYVATNRQWGGLCERTVRPRVDCGCLTVGQRYLLNRYEGWQLWDRSWRGAPCCRGCGCGGQCDLQILRLPGPVHSVLRVTVNGMDVPVESFTVQGRSAVLRTDGQGWPCSNNLARDPAVAAACYHDDGGSCGDCAWEIVYVWGDPPPRSGAVMARELACELLLRLCGSESCRLPSNVTAVNRDGVSYKFDVDRGGIDQGLTGITEVDQWITMARGGPWRPRKPTVRRADGPRRQALWPNRGTAYGAPRG